MDVLGAECLSISGGGAAGRRYLGLVSALHVYLERNGTTFLQWRDSLKEIHGSSAGSLLGLAILLFTTYDHFEDLILSTCDSNFVCPDLTFSGQFGLDQGYNIRKLVERALAGGGISPAATLGELRRLTRVNFVSLATDVIHSRTVRLSGLTHPNMRVVDAVYCSCAIPGLYAALPYEDMLLVDGCILENQPVLPSSTRNLYFRLWHFEDTTPNPYPSSPMEYACNVFHTICSGQANPPHCLCLMANGEKDDVNPFVSMSREELLRGVARSHGTVLDQLMGGSLTAAAGRVALAAARISSSEVGEGE